MASNAANLATRAIDFMYKLPSTEVLSLKTEGMDTEPSGSSSPIHSSSAPTELPPIYGNAVSEEWIEAHVQLTQEISTLREYLLRQPPPSTQAEFAALSESALGLATQIASLQKGVESLDQFTFQLAQITHTADQIQEVSDKLAALTTDEAKEKPLMMLKEVSESVEAICK